MKVSFKTSKVKEPVLNRNKLNLFFKVKVYYICLCFILYQAQKRKDFNLEKDFDLENKLYFAL